MDKFYTVQEIAEMLKVHWQTILNYIKTKKLKAVKIGKEYRIREADLSEFLETNKTK
jgi:excisionase family DNA binding protein